MSMNIVFEATREIQVIKTGRVEIQTATRSVWQTPTKVTYAIIESPNPIEAYKAWVLTQGKNIKMPIYADDDFWEERGPIGFKEFNDAGEHVRELEQWLKDMEENGWTVKVEMI